VDLRESHSRRRVFRAALVGPIAYFSLTLLSLADVATSVFYQALEQSSAALAFLRSWDFVDNLRNQHETFMQASLGPIEATTLH
jgi:hypothetical protein